MGNSKSKKRSRSKPSARNVVATELTEEPVSSEREPNKSGHEQNADPDSGSTELQQAKVNSPVIRQPLMFRVALGLLICWLAFLAYIAFVVVAN